MWRILPMILLASCASDGHKDNAGDDSPATQGLVVNTLYLPLAAASSRASAGQSSVREFQQGPTRGWINETGSWGISSPVVHTRLRCGTYEVGVQFGAGNPRCSQVRWRTNVQYGTSRTHCNSATLIHSGGETFPEWNNAFDTLSCVRVVTRCSGVC